jgi:hypothetical protein
MMEWSSIASNGTLRGGSRKNQREKATKNNPIIAENIFNGSGLNTKKARKIRSKPIPMPIKKLSKPYFAILIIIKMKKI